MKILNKDFYEMCEPLCSGYKKIDDILLVDNFFKNFEEAKNFFTQREYWECTGYQDHSKNGRESTLPNWVGKALFEKIILDNQISEKYQSADFDAVCNITYDSSEFLCSVSNSNYFPHVDRYKNNTFEPYICLVNLSQFIVSTIFYSYKNCNYLDSNLGKYFSNYEIEIRNKISNFYNKNSITREEVRIFLEQEENLDIKITKEIKYSPNQAIIYPAYHLHSPNITKEHTENNPRILLRLEYNHIFN